MHVSRFFTLFGLIFITVDAAKKCSWSLRSLHNVSSCPMTTDEKLMAEKIKKCEGLAILQNCSESSLFKYHCVLNEAGDKFQEVCAPEVKLYFGHCATFNKSNGKIEPHFNRTCNKGGRNPCPHQYISSESYRYPTCYGFLDNFTTYDQETARNDTNSCSEEGMNQTILYFLLGISLALYITLAPFIICRDRSLLCIRNCISLMSAARCSFKESDLESGIYTPVDSDATELLQRKRSLHPFPKQTSSLCITNICSINHISHISNETICLSNRKHVMEINHNGQILRYFDIDDALGSASHTIDSNGNLLFFKGDTVFRVNADGKITTVIKQTAKILSIYYSRISDEIILGTYYKSSNEFHSKLLRYNQIGKFIGEIEFFTDKTLYVLPLFITENINGVICTTDSGTFTVTGVDKCGKLHFIYDGKPTETEFYPTGICCDAFGHVIVCNRHYSNPSVHVLDSRGHFLAVILTAKDGISDPYGLCVNKDGCLYLGQYDCNTLMVYRYLDEK